MKLQYIAALVPFVIAAPEPHVSTLDKDFNNDLQSTTGLEGCTASDTTLGTSYGVGRTPLTTYDTYVSCPQASEERIRIYYEIATAAIPENKPTTFPPEVKRLLKEKAGSGLYQISDYLITVHVYTGFSLSSENQLPAWQQYKEKYVSSTGKKLPCSIYRVIRQDNFETRDATAIISVKMDSFGSYNARKPSTTYHINYKCSGKKGIYKWSQTVAYGDEMSDVDDLVYKMKKVVDDRDEDILFGKIGGALNTKIW